MAQVIGGFGVSHSPSMGYEYDKGITGRFDPRWKIWFDRLATGQAMARGGAARSDRHRLQRSSQSFHVRRLPDLCARRCRRVSAGG